MKSSSLDCQKQRKRFCDEQRWEQLLLTLEHCGFELHSPLVQGYFSTVNTAVLHGLWLGESTDVEETWIQRANYKLHVG